MIQTNQSVYIAHYVRSPFSKAHPVKTEVDAYQNLPAIDILIRLINYSLNKLKIPDNKIDELVLGCALPIKDQWSFGGRYGVFLSQLPVSCATKLIERQCASGLDAVFSGAQSILHGGAELAMCGGYENMSRVPIGPKLFQAGVLTIPEKLYEREFDFDVQTVMNMGLTAEKLAKKYNINRLQMDAFTCKSHYKAQIAIETKFLQSEQLPVLDKQQQSLLAIDTGVRPDTNMEILGKLKPSFIENGNITAGNSAPLSSGAALVVLASKKALAKYQLTPLSQIIATATTGTNPELMGEGVIPAIEKLLKISQLNIKDIDLWEINEAFSVVPLVAIKYFNLDETKVNTHGGSLAIGHPLGATGVRLAGTLARSLQEKKLKYGILSLCVGGGQGTAMLIKNDPVNQIKATA